MPNIAIEKVTITFMKREELSTKSSILKSEKLFNR